jgi:predicted secreted protein
MDPAELFASEQHDPEKLDILVEAFESAWREIEKRYDDHPTLRDEARQRLADAILKVAKEGAQLPSHIKESALLILAIEDSKLH